MGFGVPPAGPGGKGPICIPLSPAAGAAPKPNPRVGRLKKGFTGTAGFSGLNVFAVSCSSESRSTAACFILSAEATGSGDQPEFFFTRSARFWISARR